MNPSSDSGRSEAGAHTLRDLPPNPEHDTPPPPDQPRPLRPGPSPGLRGGEFRGGDLVDWLLERGLCSRRGGALLYGSRLQSGGVIEPPGERHSFGAEPALLYRFTETPADRKCLTVP